MDQHSETMKSGIRPEEMLSDAQREEMDRVAERDLAALGIESRSEHLEAIRAMMLTSNFSEGYDEIVRNLHSPEALKAEMEARGISSIIHAEGATVWDHVKATIQGVNDLDASNEAKSDLRLLMLYHDLGKAEVWSNEKNVTATRGHLEKGALHRAMIGHADARTDQMRRGLVAAGVDGKRLEQMMIVIHHHMDTSIPNQDPRKTVKIVQSFGENDDERRAVVELLAAALSVDGHATEHINLHDGQLISSKNEKKTQFSGEAIWEKYQEGLRLLKAEEEAAQKKKKDEELEKSVLGVKASDYLKKKGIEPGPEMGKTMGKLRKIIADNKDKELDAIRALISAEGL